MVCFPAPLRLFAPEGVGTPPTPSVWGELGGCGSGTGTGMVVVGGVVGGVVVVGRSLSNLLSISLS
jgi:hypothetical protein